MTTRQFFEMTYRDKFDSKKVYKRLDIIKYMGEFYVCTEDGTVGINPSNSECFHRLEFFDEQKSKTGHWIELDSDDPYQYMCSECCRRTDEETNFCPGCGTRMKSEVSE